MRLLLWQTQSVGHTQKYEAIKTIMKSKERENKAKQSERRNGTKERMGIEMDRFSVGIIMSFTLIFCFSLSFSFFLVLYFKKIMKFSAALKIVENIYFLKFLFL